MQALKTICKDLQLYSTPALNDKLYLHYKGWKCIEPCLGNYSGLKSLWLEGNGLDKVENLDKLVELRCLFMNNNLIETIEGFEANIDLDTLNLSNNQIKRVQNLSHLSKLSTLHLASNRLVTLEDIEHLKECDSISVVDLSNNKIDDPEIVEVFAAMKGLRVLHLSGNPAIRKIDHYRKTMVSRCKSLTYLDDRPVFDDERRCCEAWVRGGAEEEKAERARIKQEKEDKERRNREAFQKMLENARAKRGDGDKIKDKQTVAAASPAESNEETPSPESSKKEKPPVSRFSTDNIFEEDAAPIQTSDDDNENDDNLEMDVPPLQDGDEEREQYQEMMENFKHELALARAGHGPKTKVGSEKRNTSMKITETAKSAPSSSSYSGDDDEEDEDEGPGRLALKLLHEDLERIKETDGACGGNMDELD